MNFDSAKPMAKILLKLNLFGKEMGPEGHNRNSYRGLRHRRGLPVRGQKTKTNARTRKGKKHTVAGKKKVLK